MNVVRRAVPAVVLATLLTASLSGCFSFDKGMIHYQHGIRAGTATIRRHASRDLAFYTRNHRTDDARGAAAAGILRTAAATVDMPGFFRDRWNAATAPDQYGDIGEDIPALWGRQRCLAVTAKAAWFDIGYEWFTDPFGDGGCDWGPDPVRDVP